MVASGTVFMDDWTLATGSSLLKPGATYFAGTNGTLSTTGTQPVGIATSINTLSVTIQNQQAAMPQPTDLSVLQAQITNLQNQLNTLTLSVQFLQQHAIIGEG